MAKLNNAAHSAATAKTQLISCALRTDVYLLFSVKKTDLGFEETFCAAIYKFEPDADQPPQEEWGIVVRRGAENFDISEVFKSMDDARARAEAILWGAPAELTPALA